MQESVQKKNDLYGYEDTQKLLTSSIGAGKVFSFLFKNISNCILINRYFLKVRAMFDERRSRITAGIDKSYLLEPLAVDTMKTTKNQRQIIVPSKSSRGKKTHNYTKVIVPPLQNRIIKHERNGNNQIANEIEQNSKSSDSVLVDCKTTPRSKTSNMLDKNASVSNAVKNPQALKKVTNQKVSLGA